MKNLIPLSVILLLFGACKKDSSVPAGFDKLDRAQQCTIIVDQAMSAAVLFLVGLEGELAEEGQGMQAMIDCVKEHRAEPVQCLELDVEAARELQQKRQEMLSQMFEQFLAPFTDEDREAFIGSFEHIWQLIRKYHVKSPQKR